MATFRPFEVTNQVAETDLSPPAYGSGTATINRAGGPKRGENVRRKESVGGGIIELDRPPSRGASAKAPYPLALSPSRSGKIALLHQMRGAISFFLGMAAYRAGGLYIE